jgi:hypothetical protein
VYGVRSDLSFYIHEPGNAMYVPASESSVASYSFVR